MSTIPPEIELFIENCRKEDYDKNQGLFSKVWVEKAFTWFLYTIGGLVVTAITLALIKYFFPST